jgi:glycosyltransferase involved in cell wall biosynthesis
MSVAFDHLRRTLPDFGWQVDCVDLADHSGRERGAVTAGRVREIARAVGGAAVRMRAASVFYLTVSQSRFGFLKDSLMIRLANAHRTPVVLHLHGGNFREFFKGASASYQRYIRDTLSRVSAFIVLGDSLREQFADIPGALERTLVVENPTGLAIGTARAAPSGKFRLLYLSNLIVEKGYLDVLEGARQLAERRPEWQIEIRFAGAFQPTKQRTTAQAEEDFRRILASLPTNLHAEWLGVVSGSTKLQLLDDSDVLVLPTYYPNEGQPIAIIEAITRGLPVVATEYRSIPDIVPQSMNSLFVPAKSPAAIADRLLSLFSDAALFARMSSDAITTAERFRPEHHTRAVSDILARSAARA